MYVLYTINDNLQYDQKMYVQIKICTCESDEIVCSIVCEHDRDRGYITILLI